MSKRKISGTLRNLKFMQRSVMKDERKKNDEEEPNNGKLTSLSTVRKNVVVTDWDPQPEALVGRMSFQSFNPSIEKLNEEALNGQRTDGSTPSCSSKEGNISFRFPAGYSIEDSSFPALKHPVVIVVDHEIFVVSGLANRSDPSQAITLIASLMISSLSTRVLQLSSSDNVVSYMSKSDEQWNRASLNLVRKKGELYVPLISANTKRSGLISLNSFRAVSLGELRDTVSSGVYCSRRMQLTTVVSPLLITRSSRVMLSQFLAMKLYSNGTLNLSQNLFSLRPVSSTRSDGRKPD